MKRIAALGLACVLSLSASVAMAQDVPPPPEPELNGDDYFAGQPAPQEAYPASDCHGCCNHCGGSCHDGVCSKCGTFHPHLKKRRNELKHLRYLKSRRAGTAEYTHLWNQSKAQMYPWHGDYYHRQWGKPLALVVPPTAATQTRWGWGVGQTHVVPIYHQFARPFPGTMHGYGGEQLKQTPLWPSHTDQFGVYYIRGPW